MLARGHGDWPWHGWDEKGEASGGGGGGAAAAALPPSRGRMAGRQTVHWPFQSIATMDSVLTLPVEDELDGESEAAAHAHARAHADTQHVHPPPAARLAAARPATWQPRGHFRGAYDGSFDRSLVPDYVVNYLRGETPESVARRQAARRQADDDDDDDDEGDHDHDHGLGRRGSTHSSAAGSDRLMLEGEAADGAEAGRHGRGSGSRSRGRGAGATRSSAGRGLVLLALLAVLLSTTAVVGAVLLAIRGPLRTSAVTCSDNVRVPRLLMLLRAVTATATAAAMGSAQYVWQAVGSSPTRADVDAAHARRQWLDVGVPSLRNVVHRLAGRDGRDGRRRAVLSLVVMAAALVLAVLQGSVVVVEERLSTSPSAKFCSSFNMPLLAAIAALHGLVAICLVAVLAHDRVRHHGLHSRHVPLVTLGDAVASFLRDPDQTTADACLLSKADVVQGRWTSTGTARPTRSAPRWFRAASPARWLVGALVWSVAVGLAVAALVVAMTVRSKTASGLGSFGHVTRSILSSTSSSTSSFSLLAGLPHLGLALLYLAVDGHLSVCFLAHESALFAAAAPPGRGRPSRPLRVSARPRGFQTSSLYLTLPLPWAALLLLLSSALHFALSSAVVVVVVVVRSSVSSSTPSLLLLGLSPLGLLLLLVLLLALAVLVLGLGARCSPPALAAAAAATNTASVLVDSTTGAVFTTTTTTDNRSRPVANPLFLFGGSCSAVISARCHPLPDEVAETMAACANGGGDSSAGPLPMWLRPLAWGPVSSDEAVHHCTYTSRPVLPLELSRSYA